MNWRPKEGRARASRSTYRCVTASGMNVVHFRYASTTVSNGRTPRCYYEDNKK